MINNRQQAGRRRGRGGNPGGQQRQGNPGRPDNGNRIDSRARGNASQLYEKYKNMASDAQRQGDRVNTEYYLQFADHYFRVLSEQRGRFEDAQPRRGRDDLDFDGNGEFGEEFGDEGERANDGGDQPMAQATSQRFDRDDRGREDGARDDGRNDGRQQRDDRPRNDRDDRPRAENRGDRSRVEARDERPRDDRPRAESRPEARDDRPRGDGVRREGNGDARPRGEWQERPRRGRPEQPRPEQPRMEQIRTEQSAQPTDPLPDERLDQPREPLVEQPAVEVAGQRRADPMTPGETLEGRAEEVLEADRPLDAPAPRRRGRPRREAEPVVNGASEVEASGLDIDRLPPSLTVAANDEAPAEAKPRRRRVRPVEDTPTAAE